MAGISRFGMYAPVAQAHMTGARLILHRCVWRNHSSVCSLKSNVGCCETGSLFRLLLLPAALVEA